MYTKTRQHLLHALTLAKTQQGFCAPNPCVGAVIVNADDEVIAAGYHSGPGTNHAEVEAINKLQNDIPVDCTLYVTLEPCCHFGRTPPCTDAIIKSGIKKVIYAYRDPNPIVAGNGERILREAGIACDYLPIEEINHFYASYSYWHTTKLPKVTAKIAMTLNGKIAGKNSEPIKITGDVINKFTHQQRKIYDAILTTIKTILMDDPQLNARYDQTYAKPIFILDSELNLPLSAKIFSTAKKITIFHAENCNQEKLKQLLALNVTCIQVQRNQHGLNLQQVLKHIGEAGVHDLWIEAGGKCFAAFLEQKLLDKALIYIAPRWVDEGKDIFSSGFHLDFSTQKIRWEQIGQDVLCEIQYR